MEQHFPKSLKKGTTSRRYTQIFENFFPEVFFLHSTVLPEFLEFSVEWFAFGNSTAFEISGNVSGKFLYHLPLFSSFRKFWLSGKRPKFQSVNGALTICMENPEILERIQIEQFIPVEIFRKKSNTFRGITFFPFLPKRLKFSVPFVSWITSARLHVKRK